MTIIKARLSVKVSLIKANRYNLAYKSPFKVCKLVRPKQANPLVFHSFMNGNIVEIFFYKLTENYTLKQ